MIRYASIFSVRPGGLQEPSSWPRQRDISTATNDLTVSLPNPLPRKTAGLQAEFVLLPPRRADQVLRDFSDENARTTRLRRFISRLACPYMLLVRSRFQCDEGNAGQANASDSAPSDTAATLGRICTVCCTRCNTWHTRSSRVNVSAAAYISATTATTARSTR